MVCQNNNKLTKHLLTLSTKRTNNNNDNQPSYLRISRSHLNSHFYLNSHLHLNSNGGGYFKSLIPTLTKLAIPSLIILSTIISTCTPILSTTIPSVNAVTDQTAINNDASSTNSTDASSSTNTSSSSATGTAGSGLDLSDPNYLNTVLEANGMDTNSVTNTTNDVDPTTMATDLASLNNALETQAANEGISISLSSNNQPVSTTNPATINIDPSTATGSGVTANTILAATSITSNVKTAMPGYSLTIQQAANTTTTNNTNIANPNGSLINPANPSNNPILSTDGTPDSPKALSNNEWGYAISGSNNFDTSYTTGNTNPLTSKWAKVPTSTETAQTIKTTEDTPPTEGDNTTVYYGVNVPKNKTAGQYQTTITYTTTANILDPPEVEKVEPSTIRQGMQISAGRSSSGIFTCYLTDKGTPYCSMGNVMSRLGEVGDMDNDEGASPLYGLAPYSAIQKVGVSNPSSWQGEPQVSWYKVNTSKMDGPVVQMVSGNASSQNGSGIFTCYLTDKGTPYCSMGSVLSRLFELSDSLSRDEGDSPAYGLAPYGALQTVNVSSASSSYRGEAQKNWYKVNTSKMDGIVVQIMLGKASGVFSSSGIFTCYLTDKGTPYCSMGNVMSRLGEVGDMDNDEGASPLYGLAPYSAIQKVGVSNPSSWQGEPQVSWYKVNTSKMDGPVVQMVSGNASSQNGSGIFTCYLTDKGTPYCSMGSVLSRLFELSDSLSRDEGDSPAYGLAPYGALQTVNVSSASSSYRGEAQKNWYKVNTSKFDSSSSSAGTTVTLTGKNLSKVTNVYVDANNNGILDKGTDVAVSNLKITSDTQLTFTAPSMSAGTYNIIVVNPGNVVPGGTLTYR